MMARPTTHELDESESNSPPMERPSKIGQKPEYNSDWNSIKKAVRDKTGNSSVLNPSSKSKEEKKNNKKDFAPSADKKHRNPGSFLDANGGSSKNLKSSVIKSEAST